MAHVCVALILAITSQAATAVLVDAVADTKIEKIGRAVYQPYLFELPCYASIQLSELASAYPLSATSKKYKMNFIRIVFFLLWLPGCVRSVKNEVTPVVLVDVADIPADSLFLSDAFNAKNVIDTALKEKDVFIFNNSLLNDGQPGFVSIRFTNKQNGKLAVLLVQNPLTSDKGSSAFMLEKDTIRITGKYVLKGMFNTPVKINGGIQNKSFFHKQAIEINSLKDSTLRIAGSPDKQLFKLISLYPESFYLLQLLYKDRFRYEIETVQNMYSLFNSHLQVSKIGRLLKEYCASAISDETAFEDTKLLSPAGDRQAIFNQYDKVNVLVFWASWCAPCIQEIPALKNLFRKISVDNTQVNFVGISIDKDQIAWQKAIATYKIPWRQLLLDNENVDIVRHKFQVGPIPLLIVSDRNGKIIFRYEGYSISSFEIKQQEILHAIRSLL